MHRWTQPDKTPDELRGCVATFGNFDGVHRGHRAILTAVQEIGGQRDIPTVAVTFEPHPAALFHPDDLELIAPEPLRTELLEDVGIEGLLVVDFTPEFARQTAEEFVVSTFVAGLGIAELVVGEDTRGFGRGYTGDADTLRELGTRHGFDVVVVADVGDGERWSSTAVRRLLHEGDVASAAAVLGRPHRVVGRVVHGNHRGREMGYPTANLDAEAVGLVPDEGVYAGWLTRLDLADDALDRTMPAAISIGTNPTFDTRDRRTVEAYVLDRDDLDLYGEQVLVEFVARIRPTLRFDSVDELLAAMADDVSKCREVLARIVP